MRVKISKLKHHPLNEKIYSLSGIQSLMNSINQVGLLEPITIDDENRILSGHRRYESIKRLGWKEVEVHKINVKKGDEVLTLIHFNRQRVKSSKELLNEYFELEKYHRTKGVQKGKRVRNIISEDLDVNDSLLARILFIHKRNPDYIELIDKSLISVHQAYLNVKHDEEENIEKKLTSKTSSFKKPENKKEFTFYKKSSHLLNEIKPNSIQCIFTSPPYALGIRKYSSKVVLGTEKSVEEYSENLSNHLISCYKVLSDRGSFYLNIGDVYKDGELQNAPHKVLFKLLDKTKFKLRGTIIYKKSNPKPSSIRNRTSSSFEYIFHLVKSLNYDYERALLPLSSNTKPSHAPRHRSKKTENKVVIRPPYIPNKNGKNLPDYWDDDLITTSVANQSLNYGREHPAMYHPSLITIPVLQTCVLPWIGSNELNSNKVLDIFAGSLNTYKSIQWINKTFGTNLEFIGYDVKKYF